VSDLGGGHLNTVEPDLDRVARAFGVLLGEAVVQDVAGIRVDLLAELGLLLGDSTPGRSSIITIG
jgi:hypothetical protein